MLDLSQQLKAAHNLLKAHGRAVCEIKEIISDAKVGFASAGEAFVPAGNDRTLVRKTAEAYFALRKDNPFWSVSFFHDPIFLGDYPSAYYRFYDGYLPRIVSDDMRLISQPCDFLALNIYGGEYYMLDGNGKPVLAETLNSKAPASDIQWERQVPEAMFWEPYFMGSRYHKPVLITENGLCDNTGPSLDGGIHDRRRCSFINAYLSKMSEAIKKGIDIRGYFHWSLTDNYEWAEGYRKRFGLVYVPFPGTARVEKDSFKVYHDFIADHQSYGRP